MVSKSSLNIFVKSSLAFGLPETWFSSPHAQQKAPLLVTANAWHVQPLHKDLVVKIS